MGLNTKELLGADNEVLSTTGITFHRIEGYDGDITTNRSLYGYEVDRNFYNLKSQDIQTAEYDSTTDQIIITRVNGEEMILPFNNQSGIEELQGDVVSAISYDEETDIIKLTKVNGEELETKISHPIVPKNEPEPGFVLCYTSGETGDWGYYWVRPDFSTPKYIVTLNYGVSEKYHIEKSVLMGDKVKEPEVPEEEGYNLEGWVCNGEAYDFNQRVFEDETIEAEYEKIDSNLTFANENGNIYTYGDVINGKVFKFYSTPKDNYTFDHWEINGNEYENQDLELTIEDNKIEADAYYKTQIDGNFKKCDYSELTDDDEVIITKLVTGTGNTYALSNVVNKNNISGTEITINKDKSGNLIIENIGDSKVLKFSKISTTTGEYGVFRFENDDERYSGNLYTPPISSNYLRVSGNTYGEKYEKWYYNNDNLLVNNGSSKYLLYNIYNQPIFGAYTTNPTGDTKLFNISFFKKTTEESIVKNTGLQEYSSTFKYWDELDLVTTSNSTKTPEGWYDDKTINQKDRHIIAKDSTYYRPLYAENKYITFTDKDYSGMIGDTLKLESINDASYKSASKEHKGQIQFADKEPFWTEENRSSTFEEIDPVPCFITENNFNEIKSVSLEYCVNKNCERGTVMVIFDVIAEDGTVVASEDKIIDKETGFNLATVEFNSFEQISCSGKVRMSLKMKEYSFFITKLIILGK